MFFVLNAFGIRGILVCKECTCSGFACVHEPPLLFFLCESFGYPRRPPCPIFSVFRGTGSGMRFWQQQNRVLIQSVYPICFPCGVTWRPWRSVSRLLQWCNRSFCVDFLLKKKKGGGGGGRVYACSELKFSKLYDLQNFGGGGGGGGGASRAQILWQWKC